MAEAPLRMPRLSGRYALLVGVLSGLAALRAGAEDVYKRTERGGRTVYTNLDHGSVGGKPLESVTLDELTHADLSLLREASERVAIDARLDGLLSAYQGERCEQIRMASRGSTRLTFLKQHQREWLTALALLTLGLVLLNLYRARWLKFVVPVPPMLGALLLMYVAYDRSRVATNDLHDALRACSSVLPEADAGSLNAAAERQQKAESLREAIDRVARRLPR